LIDLSKNNYEISLSGYDENNRKKMI